MAKDRKKNKRGRKPNLFLRLLPYIGIILVAAALIVAVIVVTSRRVDDNKLDIPTLAEQTSEENPDNTQLTFSEEESGSAISALIQQYFEAVSDADVDTLSEIVVQDTAYSESSLKNDGEYIEAYRNISCYTIPGATDGTYVVYVYYDIEFIGIDTLAPSLIRLYVCEAEDGSLYIDKTGKDSEVTAYLQQVASMEEVRSLVAEVNSKLQQAKAEDENLQNFVDMLEGKETTTAAQTTEEESEEASE